jgi:nucleoside-diphosphate-sugar epimerase
MRCLITGGAGFIGSVLVPSLLNEGFAVTVVDNFMYGNSLSLAACCTHSKFDVIRGDARDPRVIGPLLAKHDVIIPLAAIVGAPACDNDVCATGTTNVVAIENMVSKLSADQWIIAPITNSGYGIGSQDECTEESPLNPVSLYGKSKVEAEKAVLSHKNGISLRLATVFGMSPRMRRDLLVNDFVWRAVTDRAVTLFEAHFRRNYVHVRDVARAFLHVFSCFAGEENKYLAVLPPVGLPLASGAYNIGLSDANLSKLQLCEKIKEHVPGFVFWEAPVGEDADKRDYVVSNKKIEATGFRCEYSLDDGIRELAKGYRMMRREYSNV